MRHKCALFAAVALLYASHALAAEPFDSKLQASTYKAKLVQAMDECASPTTIIGGVDACAPAHANTLGTNNTFSIGSVAVKSVVVSSQVLTILKSSGNGGVKGDLGGQTVHTRLVLRITKRSSTTAPTDPVTWEDQVLDCPAVTINGTGNMVQKSTLATCGLDLDLLVENYQKEIVSASIVDGSGKPLAVPGVRKK